MFLEQVVEDGSAKANGGRGQSPLPDPPALDPKKVSLLSKRNAFVLDTRPIEAFAVCHVPGAVCIPLNDEFAAWTRSLIGLHTPVIIVSESINQMRKARQQLATVGIDDVLGWLADGMSAWQRDGLMAARLGQITVHELHNYLENGWAQVLDVRCEAEWQAGHIAGAHWHPLEQFPESLPALDNSASIAVHSKNQYRGMIAASLLLRSGESNVIHVTGGFDEWQAAGLPVGDD